MSYKICLSPEAVRDLEHLRSVDRGAIMDQIGRELSVNPTLESRARIKRLREPTQYRLRVGDFRVFYDVEEERVEIVRVVSKEAATRNQGGQGHVDPEG
jgi:mRNA-degrading endonuclease RelE of RelBE toxin-antitoxin system